MISYKHMEYFIEVAQSKQILKASEKLNVSQSTITMAMKTIEDKINSKLLLRNSKGIELTYEGFLFLEHAKRIVFSMNQMINISDTSNFDTKGELNIALSFTISGYFFANYYAEFTKNFPNIKINIIEASRNEIEKGLIDGTYDLGLFNVVLLEHKDELNYETILKSSRKLWVCSNHKFLKKRSISLKEISKENIIMITVDEANKISNTYWEKNSLIPNIVYKTNSIEAIRSMVANGSGVAILADMVYRPWSLESKKVEKINIIEEIPNIKVGIVWSKLNKKINNNAKNIFKKFMKLSKLID